MRAVPIFTASPTMVIRLGATHNGTWLTTKFHLEMKDNSKSMKNGKLLQVVKTLLTLMLSFDAA